MGQQKIEVNALTPETDKEKEYLYKLLVALEKNPSSIAQWVREEGSNQWNISALTKDIGKINKNKHYDNKITYQGKKIHNLNKIKYYVEYVLENEPNTHIALNSPIKLLEQKLFEEQVGNCFLVIKDKIGAGSFGTVKASETIYWFDKIGNLHCTVKSPEASIAIKVRSNPESEDEAKISARQFPFFYSQIRQGNEEKKIDFYMPKINGQNLQDIMYKEQICTLSYQELLQIILSLARKVQNLHDLGYIHGDLKPGNIIVNLESKEATLIDFGCSRSYKSGLVGGLHASELYGLEFGVGPPQYDPSYKEYFALASIAMEMLAWHFCTTKKSKEKFLKMRRKFDFGKTYFEYLEEFINSFPQKNNERQLLSILKGITTLPIKEKVDSNTMVDPVEGLYHREVCRTNLVKMIRVLHQYQDRYDKHVESENSKGRFHHSFTGRINAKVKTDRLIKKGVSIINRIYDEGDKNTIESLQESVKNELSQLIQEFIDKEQFSNKNTATSFLQILMKYKESFDKKPMNFTLLQESLSKLEFSTKSSKAAHPLSNVLNFIAKIVISIASLIIGNFQLKQDSKTPTENKAFSQEEDTIIYKPSM
jgi:serine/threonine protein kinase